MSDTPLHSAPPAAGNAIAPEGVEPPHPTWALGTRVRLRHRPPYLKTADPMPMLRPPDLIGVEEVGQVVEVRALGQLAVRFRRGRFLLPATSLEQAPAA